MAEQPNMPTIEGVQDVRMIERLVASGEWEMPAGVQKALPALMLQIITEKGTGKFAPYKYSASARMKAARVILQMKAQNDARNPVKPPTQEHEFRGDINVHHDLTAAVSELESMEADDLQTLAQADGVLERLLARGGVNVAGRG